ncbi:MAG TPA: 50S ribosomal protein L2, partial [Steroidobacteraceae bacterium]
MALIKYKPRTPGTRAVVKIDRSHLHKGGPRLELTAHQSKTGGRNHFGRITTRHHGGGTRQKYRIIDFKRDKDGITGTVERLEYDPNRTGHIALI